MLPDLPDGRHRRAYTASQPLPLPLQGGDRAFTFVYFLGVSYGTNTGPFLDSFILGTLQP